MPFFISRFTALLSFLLLFQACAWEQGELRKWSSKTSTGPEHQLEDVGAEAREVEKFTVHEPSPAPEPVNQPAGAAPQALTPKIPPVVKKAVVVAKKKAPIAPSVAKKPETSYPEKYPDELKAIDLKAKALWPLAKPPLKVDETLFLDVDYLGMTVGKIAMAYRGIKMMGEKEVHHFQARFKSAPFYSAIYELDDRIDTYVSKDEFLSMRYSLTQRESRQSVDEVQLYDRDKMKTTAYQKQVRKDGTVKNRNWKGLIPRWSMDPFSVMYFIRGLPLEPGARFTVPVVNKAKILMMELTVEVREKIRTKKGEYKAIRVHAYTKYTGETLKSGDMMLWFSDNPEHELLKAQAKIKIGSVSAEASEGE